MNLAAPVARPAFVWNHDAVMREATESLARRLDAELELLSSESGAGQPARRCCVALTQGGLKR
jgi:hypothetical protein